MRPIQFVLLLLLLFFVPSCVLPLTPALPATKATQQYPLTPGLDDEAQETNRMMLEQGTVIQEIDIDGAVFIVRQLGSVIAFYNDKDHLLVMCLSVNETPSPAPRMMLNSPVMGSQPFRMDGVTYTFQIRGTEAERILVILNDKQEIIFGFDAPKGWLFTKDTP